MKIKYKNYTQEQVREQIAEYLKDCDEATFMNVVETCFKDRIPAFIADVDERGFRFINMKE